jgi:hypothetical protein
MRIGLAFATVVAVAVAGFAGYKIGRDGNAERRSRIDPSIRTVTDASAHRVITMRYGDIVRRPEAQTECLASGEGGFPNLFCTRIKGGRHEVIFYSDTVLVWPLDCRRCGPDGPVFDYLWTPYLVRASSISQRLGMLELRARKAAVTYAEAIREFGRPTSCRLLGSPSEAVARWRDIGIRLRLSTLSALPPGRMAARRRGRSTSPRRMSRGVAGRRRKASRSACRHTRSDPSTRRRSFKNDRAPTGLRPRTGSSTPGPRASAYAGRPL